ncbi:MAG: SMC-Scp complex subunit ScpB [candidate division FCPU426 bacterium]
MEISELKPVIEAVLFASDKPLNLAQIGSAVEGAERKAVRQVLDELRQDYDGESRGFRLVEIAEGWQLVSRPQYAAAIRRLNRSKSVNRLSRPALESLAIIAYKQPLTKAEVENIRGVNSDGVMHNLLERRLIRTVGRKDVAGRPLLYGTTREFLQVFGLKDLAELPKLTELKELLKQEPEADLWEVGPDGKLVEKNPEDLVKSPSDELIAAQAAGVAPGEEEVEENGSAEAEAPEGAEDADEKEDDDADDEEEEDDDDSDDDDDEDEDDEADEE